MNASWSRTQQVVIAVLVTVVLGFLTARFYVHTLDKSSKFILIIIKSRVCKP